MKPSPGTKRVLLQDIADATGYTVNTVSRALKNKADISRSTCEHIQKVADEMGYVRNNIASSLRSGRSRTLAVILGGVSNPFYASMTDTIHDLADELGYTVLVLCSRDLEAQERSAILTALGRQVDGVLLFPGNHAVANINLLQRAGLPFVLVSRHTEHPTYDYVVCDEETGGYLAGKHLIDAGHRKLVYFYSFDVMFSSEQRTHGLLRAAAEAGIPREDVLFYHYQNDAEAVIQLRRWKAEGFTGIFVFCDIEAWQLMSCLHSCGMSRDFGLVGFDNIQRVIGIPIPLCTVDGALQDVAETAVRLLVRRLQGDTSGPQQIMFPVQLVCRDSCIPVPEASAPKRTSPPRSAE